MVLYEVKDNECGLVYWYEKTNRKLTDSEKEEIRSKAIKDWTNIAISSAMYNDGPKILGPDLAISRGWDEAKTRIDSIENGSEIKMEWMLVGDSVTISRIKEIESSTDFIGWVNPTLIEQIKTHYEQNEH